MMKLRLFCIIIIVCILTGSYAQGYAQSENNLKETVAQLTKQIQELSQKIEQLKKRIEALEAREAKTTEVKKMPRGKAQESLRTANAKQPYQNALDYIKSNDFKRAYEWLNTVISDFPEGEFAEKATLLEIIDAGGQLTETDFRNARIKEAMKRKSFARNWEDINLYLFLLSDKISAYVKILTAVGDGRITLEVGSKQLIDFDKELSGYQPPEGFEKSISFLRQGILARSKYFYYSAEVLKARDEQNYVRAFEMNEKMRQSAIRADSLWNQGVKYLALEIMTAEKEFGKFELSIDQIFQDW